MDHVVIMKKEWELLPKIITGVKKVESRWYKLKTAHWNKVKKGDHLYFKDSGCPVSVKAKVSDIKPFLIENNKHGLEIMQNYAFLDLGENKIPVSVRKYMYNKKYAIFVFFTDIEKIKPFEIDKTGYGIRSAWLCVKKIGSIKKLL